MTTRALLPLTLALTCGCSLLQHGDGDGYTFPEDFDLYDGPIVGSVEGVVLDVDGEVLSGIPVRLGQEREVVTDAEGRFRFAEVEPGTWMVSVSVPEYAEQFRKVEIEDWETESTSFALFPTGVIFDIENSEGGVFQEGALTVDVPPYAFAAQGQAPRRGTVQLALTVPDLTETGVAGAPGDFLPRDGDGDPQILVSYGFWDIRVFEDGEEINVADGEAVGVTVDMLDEIDMPSAQQDTLPDRMPIWWFDGTTGAWVLEDEVPVDRDAQGRRRVQADLTHFTPWNCDGLFAATCVEVFVKDSVGNGVEGASVSLAGVNYLSRTSDTTDETGTAIVSGMPGGLASLSAALMVKDRPYVEEIPFVELGDAISAGTVCPVKVEIELPICMVGGDLFLNVSNVWEKGDEVAGQENRIPSGAAMFYEPSGEYGACADPLGEDMEPGDWMELDPETDTTDRYQPEDNLTLSAGDIVRISDDEDVAVDLLDMDLIEEEHLYAVDTTDLSIEVVGDLLVDGNELDIKVQGAEDGVPGFTTEDACELAVAPEVDVDTEENAIGFQKGDEVVLTLTDAGTDDPSYVLVVGEDGTSYLGKFAAGDDPRLPAWLTNEMGDEAAISLFRQNVSYLQVPNGTYVRTTTMNSRSMLAKSE